MTKKLLSILLTIVMVFSIAPVAVFAENDILDYLSYDILDEEVIIRGCSQSYCGDVVIPDTIDGYPVTEIDYSAFSGRDNIESVTIPDSVVVIGGSSFSNCSNLKKVVIGSGVREIGDSAFLNCYQLDDITVESEKIVDIAAYAFSGIAYDEISNYEEGLLYIGKYLIKASNDIEECIIKDGTLLIAAGAFDLASNLSDISIPESLIRICIDEAFSGNDFVVPFSNTLYYKNADNWENGVLYIDTCLIKADSSVEEHDIKEGTTVISDYAFCGCENLKTVSIPESVISVGKQAFNLSEDTYNHKLKINNNSINLEMIMPYAFAKSGVCELSNCNKLEYIGRYAFLMCEELESVYISDTVETIEDFAFMECVNLEYINVDKNNLYYSSDENGVLFDKNKNVLINYPAGNTSVEYEIPNGIRRVKDYAFSFCINLKNIIIPSSAYDLGEGTFMACTSLEKINIPEGVKNLEYNLFSLCISLKELSIPSSVESTYADCFSMCPSIETVYIENNSKMNPETNGLSSFYDNPFLKDIYIYDAVFPIELFRFAGYTLISDSKKIYELIDELKTNFSIAHYINIVENYNNLIVDEPIKIEDFTIHGYYGSTAETYANEHNFKFVPICDHINTETINISKADCENDGYTGDIFCNDCEEIIENGEIIPSSGHNYIENIIKVPTYSQDGLKNTVCENCGDATAEEVIPQLTIEGSKETENTDTDISIIYPDGAFDGEIEVKVTPVSEDDAFKLISNKQGNYKVTMFDIIVTVDGEKVQPNGTVLVKIPLPKGYNQNKCVVYYVADDGTMEELTTYHFKDGYVYFETDHFSYYAITEDIEESSDSESEISFIDRLITFFKMIIDFFKQIFGIA